MTPLPLAVLMATIDEVEKTDAVLAKLARLALDELLPPSGLPTANCQLPTCLCGALDTHDFSSPPTAREEGSVEAEGGNWKTFNWFPPIPFPQSDLPRPTADGPRPTALDLHDAFEAERGNGHTITPPHDIEPLVPPCEEPLEEPAKDRETAPRPLDEPAALAGPGGAPPPPNPGPQVIDLDDPTFTDAQRRQVEAMVPFQTVPSHCTREQFQLAVQLVAQGKELSDIRAATGLESNIYLGPIMQAARRVGEKYRSLSRPVAQIHFWNVFLQRLTERVPA